MKIKRPSDTLIACLIDTFAAGLAAHAAYFFGNLSKYYDSYEDMLREVNEEKHEKYYRTYMNIKSVEEAMSSRRITFLRCPRCRRIMKREKWVFYSETSAVNCCECREHGGYYVRLKMKKCPDGTYAATKKYTRLTSEYRDFYLRWADSEALSKQTLNV